MNFAIGFLRGIRNALASVFLVSNLMALFLVASLVALVWYTIVAGKPGSTTMIIGFSSSIIGTITGFYFNKDQVTAAQREQSIQGGLASGYPEMVENLRSRNSDLSQRITDMVQLMREIEAEEEEE